MRYLKKGLCWSNQGLIPSNGSIFRHSMKSVIRETIDELVEMAALRTSKSGRISHICKLTKPRAVNYRIFSLSRIPTFTSCVHSTSELAFLALTRRLF